MASSPDQVASEIAALLRSGLEQAARSARDQPERFAKVLERAAEQAGTAADEFGRQVATLPDELAKELLDELKRRTDPPDWLGLMVFLALRLRDLLGPKLSVQVWEPGDGWNRALLLTWTELALEGQAAVSLAIALGEAPIDGFIIATRGRHGPTLDAGGLKLTVDWSDAVEVRIPFAGATTWIGAGEVSATLSFALNRDLDAVPGVKVGLGDPAIGGSLVVGAGPLEWSAFGEFGNPQRPGVRVQLDLQPVLGDNFVRVKALDERYSPKVAAGSGGGPAFDIRRTSVG
jgi:hypothetical protein